MESNFNWGIIGTGGIANAFANDLKYLDNHNVKAVVSRTKKNKETYEQIVARFKGNLDFKPLAKKTTYFEN